MKSHRRFSEGSVALSLVLLATQVLANPTGEALRAGRARFDRSAPGSLTIHQDTDKVIINWREFSIAAGEATRFLQPSATSVALNRVVTANPSRLFGSLEANGKVYLINPSGILVGRGGAVKTRGFVASTLDVSDASFLSSAKLRLGGDSEASVVNEGSIQAIGGDVFLVGRTVDNSGTIRAGTVGLGAGSEVMIVPTGRERLTVIAGNPNGGQAAKGVNNEGTIEAVSAELKAAGGNIYALAINNGGIIRATGVRRQGGRVFLTSDGGDIVNSGAITANNANGGGGYVSLAGGHDEANPTTVINSGAIEARGDGAGTAGGEVRLTGDYVGLFGASVIDVSGRSGGGTALVGGDYQGRNPTIQNAARTFVDRDARIRADALARGNGGRVIVWSDQITRFYGGLSARGGSAGGNGGFAEVSGKEFLSFHGTADLGAARGAAGTILLDPQDAIVQAVGADDGIVTATGVAFANPDTVTDVTISASVLEALIGDIVFEAHRDLTINAALNLANQTSGESVIFRAGDDLDINATVVTGGATLSFFASDAGGVNNATASLTIDASVGDATTGDVSFVNDGTGGITMSANVTSGGAVAFNNSNGDLTRVGAVTVTASTLNLSGDGNAGTSGTRLNTDVASIVLAKTGGNTFVSESGGVNLSGATGGGDVDLLAGNAISINGTLNAGAGDVTLEATAGGVSQTAGSGITAVTLSLLGAGTFNLSDALNDIDTLTADVTGPVTYRDADALAIANGVVSADNPIDISTVNGTLSVNNDIAGPDVDAGTSTASLTAGSSGNDNALTINGGVRGTAGLTFVADHMTLTPDASGINGGTATAVLRPFENGTQINLGAADAAGVLGLTDAELDDIAAGTLTIGDANAGDLTISASQSISGGENVNLITGGDILNTAGTLTTAGSVSATAGGSIGTLADPLSVSTDDLTATSGGGAGDDIFITEANGLTALNLDAGAGDVNLTLTAGALADTDGTTDITADQAVVVLSAGSAQDVGSLANPLQTSVNQLSVDTSTGDGDQFLTEANGLTGLNLDAGAGNVNLTLTLGGITDTDGAADITAASATVTLQDATAQALGALANAIQTSVGGLSVDTSAGNGSQFITEANGLTALNLNAGSGDVNLTLTLGGVADTDGTTDLAADQLTVTLLDATAQDFGASGDPIATTVNELSVSTAAGDGDQFITEANGLSALNLDAGAGNLTLVLTEGAIADTDASDDLLADIATVTLMDTDDNGDAFGALANRIGTSVNDLRVDTSAGAVDGDQFVTEASGLTRLNLNAGDGDVSLTVTLGSVADTDGATDITADQATVTLLAGTAQDFGAVGDEIATSVNELSVNTSAGNGDQFITEANGLTALDLNAGSGDVNLTLTLGALADADAFADFTAGNATVILSDPAAQDFGSLANAINTSVGGLSVNTSAGDGNQFIVEDNGLTALNLNAGMGAVNLTVTLGSVTDSDGATDITADQATVTLLAATAQDFGTSGNHVGTSVSDLSVNTATGNGSLFITEANGLTALNLNAGAGDVNLTLTAGALADADALTDITADQATVVLSAGVAQDVGSLASPIRTTVNELSVDTSTGDGDQFLVEDNALTGLNLDAGAGDVNLTLTLGGITDTDGAADITAASATVTLQDATAQALGALANAIQTSVGGLSVDTSAGNGSQFITEANGLTALNLNAGSGDVNLTLTLGGVADTDGTTDLAADQLTVTLLDATAQDFGAFADPIATTVNELSVSTAAGDGDQFITEGNGLSALNLDAGAGNVNLTLTLGALADADAAADITAGNATVVLSDAAAQNLGASANRINTSVGGLSVDTSAGGGSQFITEANGLNGLNLNAGAGDVSLTLTLGALTDGDGATDLTANQATVILSEAAVRNFGAIGSPLATSVNGLSVDTSAGDGDQFITEANGLTGLSLNAGAGDVNLTLTLGGVADADTFTDITAGDLIVALSDAAAQNFGAAGNTIQTSVGTLSVDTSMGDGDQFITEANGLTALNLNADGGDVTLNLTLGAVTDADGATDIDAAIVNVGALGAGANIGAAANPIEIDASGATVTLDARGDAGGGVHVEVAQAGAVTFTDSQPVAPALRTLFTRGATTFDTFYRSDLSVRANGNIGSLMAAGTSLLVPGTLTLNAVGGSIGGGIANPFAIDAGTLNAQAATGLSFAEVNNVTLGNLSSTAGPFFVQAGNTLTFNNATVINAGVGGTAFLVANGIPGISVVGTPAMNSRFLLYALNAELTDPLVIINNLGNPAIGALVADAIDSPRAFNPGTPDPFGDLLDYFIFSLEANPPTDPSLYIDIPVEVFQPVSIVFGEYDPTKFGEVGDLWMSSSELYEIERKAGKARKALPPQVNRAKYTAEAK